jgi:hypothetical protein
MSHLRSKTSWWTCAAIAAAALLASTGPARADFVADSFATLKSDPSFSGPGEFTGKFEVDNVSTTSAVIRVTLTNTSAAAGGGYITGFAFNNPDNLITGAVLTATPTNYNSFQLLGPDTYNNTVDASPFGKFDIGAAVGGDWTGGGSPTTGILAGNTATFEFTLTGTGLDTITALDILSELSKMQGNKTGEEFIVRFKGFNNGNSDKVGAVVTHGGNPPPPPPPPSNPVPAPAGLILGLIGIGGCLLGRGTRRKTEESIAAA